jgi:hypothetical protein
MFSFALSFVGQEYTFMPVLVSIGVDVGFSAARSPFNEHQGNKRGHDGGNE